MEVQNEIMEVQEEFVANSTWLEPIPTRDEFFFHLHVQNEIMEVQEEFVANSTWLEPIPTRDEFFLHLHDLILHLHRISNFENTFIEMTKKDWYKSTT